MDDIPDAAELLAEHPELQRTSRFLRLIEWFTSSIVYALMVAFVVCCTVLLVLGTIVAWRAVF